MAIFGQSVKMVFVFAVVFLFIIRCRFPKKKSIAEIVRSRYGDAVLRDVRKFEKLDYKVRKCSLDIEFLETCVLNDVVPTFLRFRVSNPQLRHSHTYKECQRILLRQEIVIKTTLRLKLLKQLNDVCTINKSTISYFDWTHVSNLSIKCNSQAIEKVKRIQNLKLLELIGELLHHDPDDVIRNFSSHILTDAENHC